MVTYVTFIQMVSKMAPHINLDPKVTSQDDEFFDIGSKACYTRRERGGSDFCDTTN